MAGVIPWTVATGNTTTTLGLDTWQSWNCNWTGTASTATTLAFAWQDTWTSWNLQPAVGTILAPGAYSAGVTTWTAWNGAWWQPETPEETARREQVLAAARRRDEDYRTRRAAAEVRARELLLAVLTPEQADSYTRRGSFEVRGSAGGRYRINDRGQAGNVDRLAGIGDERIASYCCHPPGGLPHADAHLAQLLALVTDERKFLETANVTWRPPAPVPVARGMLRAVAEAA